MRSLHAVLQRPKLGRLRRSQAAQALVQKPGLHLHSVPGQVHGGEGQQQGMRGTGVATWMLYHCRPATIPPSQQMQTTAVTGQPALVGLWARPSQVPAWQAHLHPSCMNDAAQAAIPPASSPQGSLRIL